MPGGGGFGGVTLGVGVFGDGAFGAGVFEEDPVEDGLEFGELVAAELAAGGFAAFGFAAAGLAGGDVWLTDLLPTPDLSLSAGAAADGDATGGGVQLGASSGIDGAVAGAGAGSSARRIPAAEAMRASATPPASVQRRARDARTVDVSTGKNSIEFGPAYSDALRNTSRLGKFTKRRHEGD